MLDQIVLCGVLAFVGLLMYYLPAMKGPDAFFGVPVTDEFYRGPVARAHLRAYWFLTALLVVAAMVFVLGAPGLGLATPGPLLTAMFTAIFGPMIAVAVIWRRLKPHEVRPDPTQGHNEEPLGSKWRYVSPWVEVLLAAVLLMFAALTVWQYPHLPERIPTHWNAAGRADGWSARNPLPLVALIGMMAFLQVMLLTLLMGMGQARAWLPSVRTQEYREVRARYMKVCAQGMNGLRLSITLLLGGILWASLFDIERQAAGAAPPGMTLVWVGAALIFVALGWLIVKGLAVRRELRQIAGPGSLESAAPTAGWIGGMIYYNPHDRAVWVEKRVGIGWTLNLAQPLAWVMVGLLVFMSIGFALLTLAGGVK